MNPNPAIALSVSELLHLRDTQQSYLLLDIREPQEVMFCTFPNSLHIRMHQIPSHWHTLPQDKLIIVFCHYGTRSRMVVQYLQQQGMMNVTNLTGGIDLWAIEIEPDMERY
jgi:rhodanese-related sulfurtransferase